MSPAARILAVVSAVVSAVVLGLAGSVSAAEEFPARIELPDGFLPEGITIDGTTAWLGSRADGDILRVDLRTGSRTTLSEGPGTPSIGLKVGEDGLLYVAGGPSGSGRVVDATSGDLVGTHQFTTGTSFVNDVVLTEDTAWFTDSQQPHLYGLARDGSGFRTLTLGGEWVQGDGFAANGIATTPDGSALLVVHSGDGLLYRVDPATGDAAVVGLGDAVLANGDGLLRQGLTLYVVQNRLNQVAQLRLAPDGSSGTLVGTHHDADLDVPTTAARLGRSLYLPNARFTTPQLPETEFWITRITP